MKGKNTLERGEIQLLNNHEISLYMTASKTGNKVFCQHLQLKDL